MGWRKLHYCYAILSQDSVKHILFTILAICVYNDLASSYERSENRGHSQVECQGQIERKHLILISQILFLRPPDIIHQTPVLNQRSLRFSSGPGGIYDIDQVIGTTST